MKNKQKLLFLFLLLFLFFPLFSFAQFIATNAPCEPEIIPPLGQVAGVYCPYCSNKGEYLHLKWDLKTNFQDPVCGIECWGPSGDQCSDSWYSGEKFFDQNGNRKTKLKPKDDVFVKKPPTSTRSAVPGTNLQVSCREKNNPKITQLSAGIRVYGDNACGEPAVGEPCELPFSTISQDFQKDIKTLNFPSVVTEINVKGWDTIDDEDYSRWTRTSPVGYPGSGDTRDIYNFLSQAWNSDGQSGICPVSKTAVIPPSLLVKSFTKDSKADFVLGEQAILDAKNYTDQGYPVPFQFSGDSFDSDIISHRTVLLDVKIISNHHYQLKILDPNVPHLKDSVDCSLKPADTFHPYSSILCTISERVKMTPSGVISDPTPDEFINNYKRL